MSNMISVSSGFQYAVNIAYDINNDSKLKNFIPTQPALDILKDTLESTSMSSTDRSRILIGAYGKGKSHIMLMVLSILLKKDLSLFEKSIPKFKEDERLFHLIQNYYDSGDKILPIIITGSNTSLSQAFILALQRTLSENGMMDIMPETNYKAAASVIRRWKKEFPATYDELKSKLHMPVTKLINDLEEYDINAYELFESLYPTLTAGSVFNPFLGFDIVELYESVARSLNVYGFTGLYVIFDEFSKYLESNITKASFSDTKMLQDFAERCNRSGSLQMHLMLISHKEISNYIDKLPKQKVDGWRGVSDRFKHVHLYDNFSQTYEIIATVIQKSPKLWAKFKKKQARKFSNLKQKYGKHLIFKGNEGAVDTAIYGCYPLHPVSTFILPRLSERIAQNERTLFTFLSSEGPSTLSSYLSSNSTAGFNLVTPDLIYDYFEPLLKKEFREGEIYDNYLLTSSILLQLEDTSLEAKIVKAISLIYALAQYERLKPTKDEIIAIFSYRYTIPEITTAIDNLIEEELVVYLKKSNNFLKLKQTSGVDIRKCIQDCIESGICKDPIKDTLNASNLDNYMYPSRYNDEFEMTRYFAFMFINEQEIKADINWEIKSENVAADGIIYAIIPESNESIEHLRELILNTSKGYMRHIFILPNDKEDIDKIVREYEAVSLLRDSSIDNPLLFNEYDLILDDLGEVINNFIATYTQPENYKSSYYFNGKQRKIHRKAALTELMTTICKEVYSLTPTINNEVINRDNPTNVAINSRNKIVAALLRNQLEYNLGLTGSGQEVSIMRSTLFRTGILEEKNGVMQINKKTQDKKITNMLNTIEKFILSARHSDNVSFEMLYELLTSPVHKIGLRKGLIPIYLATILHLYKQDTIIMDKNGQVPTNLDTLLQINARPSDFSIVYLGWDLEKEKFISELSSIFNTYIVEAEKDINTYDYIVNAMRRWFLALPKVAKESKVTIDNNNIDRRFLSMLSLLRQDIDSYELLFRRLPEAFDYTDNFSAGLSENIQSAKKFYDRFIHQIEEHLSKATKELFILSTNTPNSTRTSLSSAILDWCDSLNPTVFEQLFTNGTDKCLSLFKLVKNDEYTLIHKLAKLATGLRIEDWNIETYNIYLQKLKVYKQTAEKYSAEQTYNDIKSTNSYEITFTNNDGIAITKRFERTNYGKRAQLLYNQITQALEAMGQAITEQEKRQVLMEVLENLC